MSTMPVPIPLPEYPELLPLPLQASHGWRRSKVFISTEMDGGNTRNRRRHPRTPLMIDVSWSFDLEELALFEAWFEYDLSAGTRWWSGRVMRTAVGIVPLKCRFVGGDPPYQAGNVSGPLTVITATLMTMDLPILSQPDFIAKNIGEDSYLDLLAGIHTAVNTTIPGK